MIECCTRVESVMMQSIVYGLVFVASVCVTADFFVLPYIFSFFDLFILYKSIHAINRVKSFCSTFDGIMDLDFVFFFLVMFR